MFSQARHRAVLLSLLLLLAVLAIWIVWSNSVDRIPQGGILVMQPGLNPTPQRLVHPYYYIESRRVMV